VSASSSTLATAILPVLAIVGAGWLLRKRGIVSADAQRGLVQIVLWVLMPSLVLDRVPHNPALRAGWLAWVTPAAGFFSVCAGLALAWVCAPLFGAREPSARRTFAYCVSIFNYGYVAIPLCQQLVGRDAVAVMLLFNAGIEAAIWTAGFLVLTGRFSRDAWKRLANPMTIGTLFALALNKTGAAPLMPEWLRAIFSMLGACAIPLGILTVGLALPSLSGQFSWRDNPRSAAGACLLRNALIPAVMLLPVAAAAWAWIPAALPRPLGAILAIQAAMPAGIFPIVVAQHYGGDPKTALRVAAWTSLAALLTLPLWLSLLSPWIMG
jgi:predicted permease